MSVAYRADRGRIPERCACGDGVLRPRNAVGGDLPCAASAALSLTLSLLALKNSLFLDVFSLLIRTGKIRKVAVSQGS